MKIRLFEEYSSDYYQELTQDEFDSMISDVSNFTESEFNKIKDYIVNRYKELPEYELGDLTIMQRILVRSTPSPPSFDKYEYYHSKFTPNEYKNSIIGTYNIGTDEIIKLRFHITPHEYITFVYVNLSIYKLDDEWYAISISHDGMNYGHRFKCDQLEGLYKFLSDYHPHWKYKYKYSV